jgi:sirohydrochlorin ferrochelatase
LKWVNDMESLAAQIRTRQETAGKPFKMILCATVRDDADPAVYNQAKENLRSLVRQVSQQGEVLVIPVFLSNGSVEQKVASRLEGLRYVWDGKTLLPDARISKFVLESVEQQLKN